ncbi:MULTISPECIES: hypothetical protein [Streptomyces]|uniref:hypothetical protein n=1 Tax=Streptomyces TaxID=1883 RepID=UPI00111358E1|nr:hypothetical protein [Streptomyces sp. CC77]
MGAIQQPTPAMGPYIVEMRTESFYLTRTDADPACTAAPARYEAKVPAEDVPALLASFEQVMDHPWWEKWERPDEGAEPDTSWALPPSGDGPLPDTHWTVEAEGDAITIKGPWIVWYEPDRSIMTTELCYRDLAELREALNAVSA